MTTLASSFLADLAGLDSDNEVLDGTSIKEEVKVEVPAETLSVPVTSVLLEEVKDAITNYLDEVTSEIQCVVSDFPSLPETVAIREKAEKFIHLPVDTVKERDLLQRCSHLILKLDQEIVNVSRYVADIYGCQFPELSSIVSGPVEYIQLVRRAKYEMDFTKIDMNDLLVNQVQVAVNVAASMATGDLLGINEMSKVIQACEEGMALMELREVILSYIETRMDSIAPNVSVIIGKSLGARLITLAEGLQSLATMPSQNLILLGSEKRNNSTGGAITSASKNQGLLSQSDLFLNTPKAYQPRALRLLSGKVSLAARVDYAGTSRDGRTGQQFREQIIRSLHKSQTPPPPPLRKPLPKPKEGGGKNTKRGGRRIRKLKEKLGMTRLAKDFNRMKFGTDADRDDPVSD